MPPGRLTQELQMLKSLFSLSYYNKIVLMLVIFIHVCSTEILRSEKGSLRSYTEAPQTPPSNRALLSLLKLTKELVLSTLLQQPIDPDSLFFDGREHRPTGLCKIRSTWTKTNPYRSQPSKINHQKLKYTLFFIFVAKDMYWRLSVTLLFWEHTSITIGASRACQ